MFRPRIIPALLLKDDGLVKTIHFKEETYIGDPINAVKLFNDYHADELVFLDITASKEGRTISPLLVKSISEEAFMPFSAGGGIRTLEDAKRIIAAGAEKVIINTAFAERPEIVTELSEYFGSQAVIVSLDAKRNNKNAYDIVIYGAEKNTGSDLVAQAQKAEQLGAGEILLNCVNRDGTMEGFDYELIQQVSASVRIPVIALGGAGNLEDFSKAISSGASAVSAGSLFVFHGPRKAVLINYPNKEEKEKIFHG